MQVRLESGDVDPTEALIYLWQISDPSTGQVIYRYVGKAKNGAGRPLSDYKRNVGNLLHGRPYRKGQPQGFRAVHRRLAEAIRSGHDIHLRFLCNVRPDERIDDVERAYHRQYEGTLSEARDEFGGRRTCPASRGGSTVRVYVL